MPANNPSDNPLTAIEAFAESVDPLEVPCSRRGCFADVDQYCALPRLPRFCTERWHVAIALKLEGCDVEPLPETETVQVGDTLVSFAKRGGSNA